MFDSKPTGPVQKNVETVIANPQFLGVPFCRHVYCDNYRNSEKPDIVGIDASRAVAERMYIVVGLEESTVIEDESH